VRHYTPHSTGVGLGSGYKPEPDLSNTSSWELGEVVANQKFNTDGDGNKELSFTLKEGAYRAVLETKDRFGKDVKALLPILVLNPKAKRFGVKIPNHVASSSWRVEPGDSFKAIWGTGYRKGRAFVEIVHRKEVLQSYWTDGKKTQAKIEQKVSEAMRGGFTFRVTYVRENRAYLTDRQVDVPWTSKDLEVKWERFTSKLEPAVRETWTAVITGPGCQKKRWQRWLPPSMTNLWMLTNRTIGKRRSPICFAKNILTLTHALKTHP
jgi:hypothetical protein